MKTDRVANLLNDWLSSNRYQQTALARKSGLTQLSFLRNGLRGMTSDALDRLLPVLREEDRPILLKQWLHDLIPDRYRKQVSIQIDGFGENGTESHSGFPTLEEAFAVLHRTAPRNRELSRVLVNLASLVREEPTRRRSPRKPEGEPPVAGRG
jgi:hypothetical protein